MRLRRAELVDRSQLGIGDAVLVLLGCRLAHDTNLDARLALGEAPQIALELLPNAIVVFEREGFRRHVFKEQRCRVRVGAEAA